MIPVLQFYKHSLIKILGSPRAKMDHVYHLIFTRTCKIGLISSNVGSKIVPSGQIKIVLLIK